ncbi:hypothetical protein OROHE_001426 [Orobanche hederae]
MNGDNYMTWRLKAKLHVQSNKLDHTIKEESTVASEYKAKALIFLCHHIHDDLKAEYLCEEDPLNLWSSIPKLLLID